MVERETRLNAEEKERYEKLLQKDYFTKADFNDLDQFYSKSYDKLSSDGKAEMHQRIEEGIKRGEFSRDELPKSVREAQSNYKDVESGVTVKADRASKISGDVSASNGSVRGDSPDQVASIQYATDSNPEKLKQAAAKAKAAVPSDTLQGLELAFDDSIEPTKPAAAKTNGSSKETSI